VDVAGDGREGLKLLGESDYALVLMDCMMPVLDGYETTAAIRDRTSNVRNHAIPVIALTANAMREDRDKCLAAGMDDYISKPIVVPLLLATLEKWSKPTGRLAGPCP
jgi:CheY-like chemotaxis protein